MRSDYRENSSAAIAYYLMLKSKTPIYLVSGRPMLLDNVSSISNKKHRHHIFPKALLENNGFNEKWINCIINICFLEADQNQSIGASLPKTYLTKYEHLKHFRKAMSSHLIPISNYSPIWSSKVADGFLDFINKRVQIVLTEIQKISGTEIFEKFDDLKRI